MILVFVVILVNEAPLLKPYGLGKITTKLEEHEGKDERQAVKTAQ